MNLLRSLAIPLYRSLLSEHTKEKAEKAIIYLAVGSFLLHLLVITLVDLGWVSAQDSSRLLNNPIAAIYTPFSMILFYEVYLLVYYLPQSFTSYIGKQYEIISLIVIRRIFKDLSNLELTENWFQDKYDLQFTYDILAILGLFFLILLFYRLNAKRISGQSPAEPLSPSIQQFIRMKKGVSLLLVPVFVVLATYSLGHWVYENFFSLSQMVNTVRDVNKVFFDEFFSILILVDVLLLLLSLQHTDKFSTVIRNSGFIISTILLRLSFGVDGLLNTLLIVVAVLFGVIIMALYNQYEKLEMAQHR